MYFPSLDFKKTRVNLCSVVLLLSLLSCSGNSNQFDFDSEKWKSDLNGCQGERLLLEPKLEDLRLQLVGLKEHNIRPLLGKPDAEELMERSQKIYIYYISPGPKCQGEIQTVQKALTVRFDALGTVREANLHAE